MPECVQAAVAGVPLETQFDVKTRWTDGSLRHALVSFWIECSDNAHARIDFLPAPCASEAAGLSEAADARVPNGARGGVVVAGWLEQPVSARAPISPARGGTTRFISSKRGAAQTSTAALTKSANSAAQVRLEP